MSTPSPPGNPFQHPEVLEPRNDDPLCPWRFSSHRDLYVSIDDMLTRYDEFAKRFTDLSPLEKSGQLILVTGASGTGKTSLVHKCAAHLHKCGAKRTDGEVDDTVSRVKIVNFNDGTNRRIDPDSAETMSLGAYASSIYKEVVNTLASMGVKFPSKSEMDALSGSPSDGYNRLSAELRASGLHLVLLLPPVDTDAEIIQYSRFAKKNIAFMMEISGHFMSLIERRPDKDPIKSFYSDLRAKIGYSSDCEFRHLHVGRLKTGDHWDFVQKRVPPKGSAWSITEQTINDVYEARPDLETIDMWRSILFGVFGQLSQGGEVKATDFWHYVFLRASLNTTDLWNLENWPSGSTS